MNQKPVLSLAEVKLIAAAAEAEAMSNNWAVSIAIVDDGGHLLWQQRLDGAAPLTSHIAPAKARTAAVSRRESRFYEEMINAGRPSFLSAPYVEGLLEGALAPGRGPVEVQPRVQAHDRQPAARAVKRLQELQAYQDGVQKPYASRPSPPQRRVSS